MYATNKVKAIGVRPLRPPNFLLKRGPYFCKIIDRHAYNP
jgi:hypothetical protein